MSFRGLDVYDGATTASVVLRWPAQALATSYDVLLNGSINQSVGTAQVATVSSLVADTSYTLQVRANLSAGGPTVSNAQAYRYDSRTTLTVTPMPRPFPFPTVGYA